MPELRRICAVVSLCLFVLAAREAVAQYTWVGSGASPPNGIYSNPASWTPNFGLVPGGADLAFFNANATYTVTFTGNQALGVASLLNGNVSWLSDSAALRQFNVGTLIAGGGSQTLTIGSTTNPVLVTTNNLLELGTINSGGNGTIVVSGANTTLNGPGAVLGSFSTSDGTLRYQNGAQGSMTGIMEIGNTANNGCDGLLEILSGADLSAGNLNLATTTSTAVGTINVTGAGSTLVQSGASTLTVGSATGGVGTINVNTGGTFTSGSGLITVNATGTINRTGTGVFNVTDDLLLDGGKFLTPSGDFSRTASQSLTLQNGGLFSSTPSTPGTGQTGAGGRNLTSVGTVQVTSSTIRLDGGSGGGSTNINAGGGGGLGGKFTVNGGTVTLAGQASVVLTGGSGGGGNFVTSQSGGTGGAGGTLEVHGGSLQITGQPTIALDGGNGGGSILEPGGSGGAGGALVVSGGTFTMDGGQVSLAGGSGGGGSTSGGPGAPGAINLTGGTFTLNGGVVTTGTFTRSGTGIFNFNGGTLRATTFNGNLTNAGGTLAPGASPATLAVNGNYTQNSGALEIELGGTSVGQFDKLAVTGAAALGATLNVPIINNFIPQAGNSFDILDWGTLSGTFATLNLPGGGLAWNTSQLYTNGTLSVGGLVGDYNLNGTVDAADYVVWRNTFGQTGAGLAADGDFNNVIDAGDLAVFRAHFSQTILVGSATANTAVPEPSVALSLLVSISAICVRRRERRINWN